MLDKEALLAAAREARGQAYAPYSGFSVGAAVLCEDGRIFTGCNLENAAYSPTLCAERVALGAAVAAGVRCFSGLAVVGGHGEEESACPPCGVCRQTLIELASGEMPVLFIGKDGLTERTLSALLPDTFTL